jgi:uncharacterized protein with PIN domain
VANSPSKTQIAGRHCETCGVMTGPDYDHSLCLATNKPTQIAAHTPTEFRKQWSHKPAPIAVTSTGLWYSEECVDQLLAEYVAHVHQAMKEALEAAHEAFQDYQQTFGHEAAIDKIEAALKLAEGK